MVDLDDYRWLVSETAKPWFARAAEAGGASATRVFAAGVGALRRDLSAGRVHLILQQIELRRRGAEKFSAADRMFFTPKSLEQATDQWVAGHKAARFPASQPAADLCCGTGGDLLAMAARGETTGVERDPVLALLAAANLEAGGRSNTSRVVAGDATDFLRDASGLSSWHIDPDRRPAGRRSTRVELHEPSADTINRMLEDHPAAAIKLAPATDVPSHWADQAELEWISRNRQCRQLVAWFGDLAREPGHRRATILGRESSETTTRTVLGDAGLPHTADRIGRFVFEADAAVLAAGLLGALAAEHDLHGLGNEPGYLTADRPVDDLALACFEVLDVLPFDLKQLRPWLSARRIGRLEIKKRAPVDEPEIIRRRLKLTGDSQATLLATVHGGSVKAVLAQRRHIRADERFN